MKKPPIYKSFWNAFIGIFQMLRSERNFQIEVFALLINLFLIVYLHLSTMETILILLVCFAVLSAEIFNTAIEKICDIIKPEHDLRIKFIKDISAGAVLLLAFAAVIIGIGVYYKYLFN